MVENWINIFNGKINVVVIMTKKNDLTLFTVLSKTWKSWPWIIEEHNFSEVVSSKVYQNDTGLLSTFISAIWNKVNSLWHFLKRFNQSLSIFRVFCWKCAKNRSFLPAFLKYHWRLCQRYFPRPQNCKIAMMHWENDGQDFDCVMMFLDFVHHSWNCDMTLTGHLKQIKKVIECWIRNLIIQNCVSILQWKYLTIK